jgi:hypothetical protein
MSNIYQDDATSSSTLFFAAVVAAVISALGGVAAGRFLAGAVLALAFIAVGIVAAVRGERTWNRGRDRRLHWVPNPADDGPDGDLGDGPGENLAETVDAGYARLAVVFGSLVLGAVISVVFPALLAAGGVR